MAPTAPCGRGYTTSNEDALRRPILAPSEEFEISTSTVQPRLQASLGELAGITLTAGADLARLSTFRIGGTAEMLAVVESEAALGSLLREVSLEGTALHLIGLGSNVLFPDDGLEGVVVRLEGGFKEIRYEGDEVIAGAAVALPKLARRTAEVGLRGLEALCGFPSTVGGAVVMNAGCYGTEISDVLTSCRVIDRRGKTAELAGEDLDPGYRSTNLLGSDKIVLSARFRLQREAPGRVVERIEQLNERRWDSLPMGQPNVGSIFKNPEGDAAGRLIDECGLKGATSGGAQISPKHGNVIVNTGGARAADVVELMLTAYHAVRERFKVELEPEVILTGGLRPLWDRSTKM